jgi:uncharacterized protein YukE
MAGSVTTINIPSVTEKIAGALKEIAAQEDLLKKITGEIDFMEDAWESGAQKIYAAQFRTTRAEADKFNASLMEYLQSMRKFAGDCAAADETVAGSIRGVSI